MKLLIPAVLMIFALSIGCLSQPAPHENVTAPPVVTPMTLSGCSYGNPPCEINYTCINNKCFPRSLLGGVVEQRTMLANDSDGLASLTDQGSAILDNYNVDITDVMKRYAVGPKEDTYVNFWMKKGYFLQGNLSIVGGSDNDIDFSLLGSNGTAYVPKKRISAAYQISFTAPMDDKYIFDLGNMFTSFDIKQVRFDMMAGKYAYFQQYLSWVKNYSSKAEIVTQHLADFKDFISKNETDLKEAGVETVSLNNLILGERAKLQLSVTGVRDNIKNMSDYFQAKEALQQNEEYEAENAITNLDRIAQILG